ncbi:hypothetical protein LN042_06195 [Kitasatospora sp. RB6PN24]|uniref:hypothetical protein n=1 Tax=Kitasatospora humi TaxID=2893891 RepID=UPI001E49EF6E|nr:hypothetical protein [Kitasatospora humi]MCC9306700.1 hypothetical protein [Kitasatospora humi]
MADEVRSVMPAIRQARAALDELEDALVDREVDVADLSAGLRVTLTGAVLVQLRPLLPTELLLIAEALRQ